MNRKTITLLLGFSLFVNVMPASADFFKDLKSKVKGELKKEAKGKAKDEAKKAIPKKVKKSTQRSAAVATGASSAGAATVSLGDGPSDSLTSMTTCASFKPENIVTGYIGDYTFQNGFKKEKRSGLIKRKAGELKNGCVLPSLQSRQIAYMEVDTKAFEALGSSNDWSMQCVRSDKPGEGAISESEPRTESVYSVDTMTGKDMMLHCGNSEGLSDCAEGSNSNRRGAWSKKLKAKGKTMLSISAFTSTLAPAGGEKLYCQYYNNKARVSLFAFEYIRSSK